MLMKRDRYRIQYLTGIAVVFSVLLTGSVFSQTGRRNDLIARISQHAVWDPTEFILDKLRMNRIVMIGDDGHGDPLYFKIVISSLNKWLSTWEKADSKKSPNGLPDKLFLVLEEDSLRINSLKHYFFGGKPIELVQPVNFWGYQFTTSTLEFYYDLKTFWQRVEGFNRNHKKDFQVSFNIFGPEKIIDLSNWSTAKKDSFFIYERDEHSSYAIINLLEGNPDAKALIYYGDAHLIRGKVQKMQRLQSMGYFLAHYLTQSFTARGGVYTCNQLDVSLTTWVDHSIRDIGKTFAVDNSVLSGAVMEPNATFAARDGSIFEFVPPRQPRHISTVLSENLVNYAVDSIETYRDTSKEFYRGNMSSFLYYLSTYDVVDVRPTNHSLAAIDSAIRAWKRWRASSKLNIVKDISTLNFFKRYVDRIRMANEKLSTAYQMQLARIIGMKVWFPDEVAQQERADSIWSCIQRYRKPIVVQNLINLLWIGSDDEIQEALVVLKSETGQSFMTAKEGATWWESRQ